jgi:hypothetical protein
LLLSLMLRESKPCGGDVSCMYYYIFSASWLDLPTRVTRILGRKLSSTGLVWTMPTQTTCACYQSITSIHGTQFRAQEPIE